MHSSFPFRIPRARAVLAGLASLALVAACEGGGGRNAKVAGGRDAAGGKGCAVDTAIVGQAVTEYIAGVMPKPLRFLYLPTTDSALPDPGVQALQNKGPTWLYSNDPKLQKQVRDRLSNLGPYNTLLVTYHGLALPTYDTATVRLGGAFVGFETDGQRTPYRTAVFTCTAVGTEAYKWRFVRIAGEQGT